MFQLILSDPKRVADLFELSMSCIVGDRDLADICDFVARSHDATCFMVFEYDLKTHASPKFHASEAARADANPVEDLISHRSDPSDDEGYKTLSMAEAGQVISEAEFAGLPRGSHYDPSPWAKRVMSWTGAAARFGYRINSFGPHMDVAVYHSRSDGEAYHCRLEDETQLVHPVLARIVETQRTLHALSRGYAILLALFDKLRFPVAFCDDEMAILMENTRFREMLADQDVLANRSGRLVSPFSASTVQLREVFHSARAGNGSADTATCLLPRRSGRAPLVARVSEIRETQVDRTRPVYLLLLADPSDDTIIDPNGLRAFDVLSDAEVDVCSNIICGLSTAEVAALRNTTLETARSQVKSALAKLGCRSRLDLARLAIMASTPVD